MARSGTTGATSVSPIAPTAITTASGKKRGPNSEKKTIVSAMSPLPTFDDDKGSLSSEPNPITTLYLHLFAHVLSQDIFELGYSSKELKTLPLPLNHPSTTTLSLSRMTTPTSRTISPRAEMKENRAQVQNVLCDVLESLLLDVLSSNVITEVSLFVCL
jgi:hypothetical protein